MSTRLPAASASIAADDFNRRMLGKPPLKRLGCPVGKQIHNAMPFQVNQYGSVFLSLAPRPVVDAQHPMRYRSRLLCHAAEMTQQCVATHH